MQQPFIGTHFITALIAASNQRRLACVYPLTNRLCIAQVLAQATWLETHGLIYSFFVSPTSHSLTIYLKYVAHGRPLLTHLQVFSRPGHSTRLSWSKISRLIRQHFARFYCISTPSGLLTATEAYTQRQAGLLLYAIW